MATRPTDPRATHEVSNQSVPFADVNLFELDLALTEALEREGAGWAVDRARVPRDHALRAAVPADRPGLTSDRASRLPPG